MGVEGVVGLSKTTIKILGVAVLLYASSYVVFRVGRHFNPDIYFGTEDLWQFTMWDYVSCGLLVAAVGGTVAALRLRD
jgi:hypothetical protein